MCSKTDIDYRSDHAAAARSCLSAPRQTIITSASGNGRCSALRSVPATLIPGRGKFRGIGVTIPQLDGVMVDGCHHMQVRVFYEDTDFSGIVYHANYLRFMERGRTNHLRLLGAQHRALFEEASAQAPGFAFVVRSMQIEFLKPACMDDALVVVTAPQDVKGASIVLQQRILR